MRYAPVLFFIHSLILTFSRREKEPVRIRHRIYEQQH